MSLLPGDYWWEGYSWGCEGWGWGWGWGCVRVWGCESDDEGVGWIWNCGCCSVLVPGLWSCHDVTGVVRYVNRKINRNVIVLGTFRFLKSILGCSVFTHASHCLPICFFDIAVIAITSFDRIDDAGLHVLCDKIFVAEESLNGCWWFREEMNV